MKKLAFLEALSWTQEEGASKYVGGVGNKVVSVATLFHFDWLTDGMGLMITECHSSTV